MLSFAALCNNSTLSGGLDRPSAAGEPTEVALVLAAANRRQAEKSVRALLSQSAGDPL